jgi:3-oxoacyl-(acyl-carrier-protein) synthase
MGNITYYINGLGIVSPQKTYDNNEFLSEIASYSNNVLHAVTPEFKEYINPVQLRRLSRMLRIGLTAAVICTRDAGALNPDGIITGTGYGFLNDTEKFVSEMLDQQEKHLTPTYFMQGTYNALSGLIAITFKCNGYNNTYVNKGFSFETALHDAMMNLKDDASKTFLVGCYDEADDVQYKVNSRMKHYKYELINSLELFNHKTKGSLQGEGAAFFLLSAERKSNCWAVLKGVKMIFMPDSEGLLIKELQQFLSKVDIAITDVDIFISGVSGDIENDRLLSSIAENIFSNIPEVRFKHLCGEYCTASSFGMWLGASILKKQILPEGVQFNTARCSPKVKNVLLINQYMGRNYSFLLLQSL